MSRLQSILDALREEAARLGQQAGPGPGDLDLSRLDDEQLDRLDVLVRRECGEPRPRTREEVLAGKQHPDTYRRNWESNPGVDPPPRAEDVTPWGPLSDAEQDELAGLLERARIPEPWKAGGDQGPGHGQEDLW